MKAHLSLIASALLLTSLPNFAQESNCRDLSEYPDSETPEAAAAWLYQNAPTLCEDDVLQAAYDAHRLSSPVQFITGSRFTISRAEMEKLTDGISLYGAYIQPTWSETKIRSVKRATTFAADSGMFSLALIRYLLKNPNVTELRFDLANHNNRQIVALSTNSGAGVYNYSNIPK